jgi:hypothetical protein
MSVYYKYMYLHKLEKLVSDPYLLYLANNYRLSSVAEPVSLTFHSALRKLNTFHRCFPPNIGSFWQSSFKEEDFWK